MKMCNGTISLYIKEQFLVLWCLHALVQLVAREESHAGTMLFHCWCSCLYIDCIWCAPQQSLTASPHSSTLVKHAQLLNDASSSTPGCITYCTLTCNPLVTKVHPVALPQHHWLYTSCTACCTSCSTVVQLLYNNGTLAVVFACLASNNMFSKESKQKISFGVLCDSHVFSCISASMLIVYRSPL